MKNIIKNAKGIYLNLKKDNASFSISKKKIEDCLQSFPFWMKNQIEDDINFFRNKNNDIDKTIANFKRLNLLKDAQLIRIKIKDNKISYQNFMSVKFHPRFVRLKNFFKTVLKYIKFSDVVFLYSTHDSFDNKKWLELLESPVFCISKLRGNNKVILFPHIEWMQKNDRVIDLVCKAVLQNNWNDKINKVFWRGSITGYEDLKENERYKIVKFASQYPQFFDVYFSNLNSNKKNINDIKPFYTKGSFPPYNQLKYKYLLAVDGHAFAGSFFWQLFSNSLIFKNQSHYLEWYYNKLGNNEHFVEYVNEEDLLKKIIFFNANERLAQRISKNANLFANNFLTNENIIAYIYRLLEMYSKVDSITN